MNGRQERTDEFRMVIQFCEANLAALSDDWMLNGRDVGDLTNALYDMKPSSSYDIISMQPNLPPSSQSEEAALIPTRTA